jgi:hypothetical protein
MTDIVQEARQWLARAGSSYYPSQAQQQVEALCAEVERLRAAPCTCPGMVAVEERDQWREACQRISAERDEILAAARADKAEVDGVRIRIEALRNRELRLSGESYHEWNAAIDAALAALEEK